MEPVVDVIIAVHTETRPIARAVASILDHNAAAINVWVVAHNIAPDKITNQLGQWASDPRVKLLEFRDGIHSPAGPFNFGIASSTAPFFAVLGSDDSLEAGAIDSWLALQRKVDAAMVIARIYYVGRGFESSPPIRILKSGVLNPVKDRLAYRSAPLGIISREAFGQLRFTEGLESGEDLAYVTRMWFSKEKIAFDRFGPTYEGHNDAEDRVTYASRTIDKDFRFLNEIIDTPWFAELSDSARLAIVVKIIRIHVFDAIFARVQLKPWTREEHAALAEVLNRLLRVAPKALRLLSRIDQEVLVAATADSAGYPDSPGDDLPKLMAKRRHFASLAVLLPRNPFLLLHRQAPLRTLAAGFIGMYWPPRRRRSQRVS